MEITNAKKSLEKSKKKNIGELYTFSTILLTDAFLLPILLILGIELHKQINVSDWDALEAAVLPYLAPYIFLGLIFTIIFFLPTLLL